MHRHGTVSKPIQDHRLCGVIAQRYQCPSCARTFRPYPSGITRTDPSQRTVILAALRYGVGLSCAAASHLLSARGAPLGKTTVWRDAQEAGEALRRQRPTGKVRVLGADETVFRVKGKAGVRGFVVDGQSGRTLGFEVLFAGDGKAFKKGLEPDVKDLGAAILVSDDNDSYGVATAELGLSHPLCIVQVRKYVKRRSQSISRQAEGEWGNQEDPK